MKISLLFVFVLLSSVFQKPTKDEKQWNIYVFFHRYDDKGKKFIQRNSIFKRIDLIGENKIDPNKNDTFNYKSIEAHLLKLYPKTNAKGVLCINVENKIYQNLKEDNESDNFIFGIEQFVKMVNFIRKSRPNVKIGIYGIPFRTYYTSQLRRNKKLDVLLAKTDIIFPSLYLLFPDKQRGEIENNRYLKENLVTAFYYADRLNKPVMPFVWYIVSPNNKQFGGELLGKKEMSRYVNFIRRFTSKKKNKVNAIVWWESSKKSFLEKVKKASHLENEKVKLNSTDILIDYSSAINRIK